LQPLATNMNTRFQVSTHYVESSGGFWYYTLLTRSLYML